jgi:hypothetical protein
MADVGVAMQRAIDKTDQMQAWASGGGGVISPPRLSLIHQPGSQPSHICVARRRLRRAARNPTKRGDSRDLHHDVQDQAAQQG